MSSEENKTQDISQQDTTPVEPTVIEQEEDIAPASQRQEEIPVVESSVEPTTEQAETPKIEETQSQVVEEDPIAPLTQSEEPRLQIQEKIAYKTDPNIVQKLLVKARAKIQERKQKKLDRIMALFEAKSQVANKDIQKLLRISSATAVRYLDILESEDRIKQVGNTGKSVFYTKI